MYKNLLLTETSNELRTSEFRIQVNEIRTGQINNNSAASPFVANEGFIYRIEVLEVKLSERSIKNIQHKLK